MIRLFVAILFLVPGAAHAADLLKKAEVENFVKVMEAMEGLEGKYPDAEANFDMNIDFQEAMGMMDTMFKDGKINVFGPAMDAAMKHPEFSRDMMKILRGNGFSSVESFADVGNRVAAAMMRAEMSNDDLQQMKMMASLPESQMAMIPEPMRKMAMMGPTIAAAMEKVPAADVKLVKKMKPLQ
ncbi:MAG: hypothetical protein AAF830_01480 [Pseudomonadota bacterium]